MKRIILTTICALCAFFPSRAGSTVERAGIESSTEVGSIRTVCFDGTLGQYGIHMRLQFNDYNNTVTGTYYYDHVRARGNYEELTIRGTYTGDFDYGGSLLLIEYNTNGKKIGQFKCEMTSGHESVLEEGILTIMCFIDGEYLNYSSNKSYDVSISFAESYKNGVRYVSPGQY